MRQHGMCLEDGDFVLLWRLFQTSANMDRSYGDDGLVLCAVVEGRQVPTDTA